MKSLLIIAALAITACQEDPASGDISVQAWDTTFFAPKVGEKWIYRVTSKSLTPSLPHSNNSTQVSKTVSERVQTYVGTETIEDKVYHQISVSHDGQFYEGFLFSWDGKMLKISGSYAPDTPSKIVPTSVPIAQIDMNSGTYWHWPESSPTGSGSRVVALETIKVPAGNFEAYKISIRKNTPGTITLREYWFSPRIGIIKETTRTYSGGKLKSLIAIDLIDRIIPR